ncbi:PQQ-dependent sugar dehydrogenase [Rhodococcus jostii]|uniref:Glucose/arabinose dehydrogenase, beta-propeller fold n=1 Tax=Rhodococcus jostii TaxID=132919 RepID=A0A1H5G0A7_RHOJO|nr:PQQ-dependent sugar dehydrogenase [Rhodococcus jostii]SEE09077.1 Glucose/arabinose dehydrogenase, beta-propeller fold [Rhodococcus jostii]
MGQRLFAATAVLVAVTCAACQSEGSSAQVSTPSTAAAPSAGEPTVVAADLEVPWGIAFLPDGTALIAERDSGAVRHLQAGGVTTVIGEVPGVAARGESGLLGLAVSPAYASDQTIYAYLTTDDDNRVVALRFDGRGLGEPTPILTGIPAGSIHDGGRIAFGPDGKLYVATGEAGDRPRAQDPSSLGGKILRINPDGSIPADNPTPGSPVWSLGHRNVQGLAWDDAGRLWATEFGANTWDEVNLIEPGANYGWPEVEGQAGEAGFVDPVIQWATGDASPSGLAFHDGSLWMAALRGERLWRIPVGGDGSLGEPQSLFEGEYGRLRTVVATPDGALWFSTSNRDGRGDPGDGDDRILMLRP